MWRHAGFLLLYLPVCYTHYGRQDLEEDYQDTYERYEGDVVTMPELKPTPATPTNMRIDINKLLLTPDPRWLGFSAWPDNPPEATSISTVKSSRDFSANSTRPLDPRSYIVSTDQTTVRRNQEQWTESRYDAEDGKQAYGQAEKDNLNWMTSTTSTTEESTPDPHLLINKRDVNVLELLNQMGINPDDYGREGDHSGSQDDSDTTLLPRRVRTYWAGGRPHTYPKSIFVNGSWHMLPENWPFHTTHTCPVITKATTTTTTTSRPPTLRLDMVGLLSLIANLTYFYDMNLTERFNETLIKYGVPTCGTPTTTTTPTPTTPVIDFANTTIVGKCFVCGLDKEEIPQDAYCADAFAGDFLPLNPVDARAKGKIARYRKYCRYLDVRTYELNPDEPRAVYGRFTGGCSVRWTDLSGVYTQRACRNKRRAVLGKHFASKRMAKLEMALNNVDNGCIISPMATLLPLSRGVSLYARFHACVCTGAWCNRAARHDPWLLHVVLVTILIHTLELSRGPGWP